MLSSSYRSIPWFEKLFGIREFEAGQKSMDHVRENFILDGPKLTSKANNRVFHAGEFSTPTVKELHQQLQRLKDDNPPSNAKLTIENISADVKALHMDVSNSGAVFQAASQFNCLEMPSPHVTPEEGITGYAEDRTQGPICAMCCAAGTVYRNYLVEVENPNKDTCVQKGQSSTLQLNTMRDIELLLQNDKNAYWKMTNGYLLPKSPNSLEDLNPLLLNTSTNMREKCVHSLRVGVQWDTEVSNSITTNEATNHRVCQVYSSAVPMNYDSVTPYKSTKGGVSREQAWEPLASTVLDATYEATLLVAAMQSLKQKGRTKCYLTKVGGGVFGNKEDWIVKAIQRSLDLFRDYDLDVKVVHYGGVESAYTTIV